MYISKSKERHRRNVVGSGGQWYEVDSDISEEYVRDRDEWNYSLG